MDVIVHRTGIAAGGLENVQGEVVKKLDILSNEVFVNCISSSNKVSIMVSEEVEDVIIVSSAKDAKYAIVFDPLDGSSNIDAGVSIGSIFGIYRLV